jgi:hypothetical protein
MTSPPGWHNYGSYRRLKEEWLHIRVFNFRFKEAREGLPFGPFKARKEFL